MRRCVVSAFTAVLLGFAAIMVRANTAHAQISVLQDLNFGTIYSGTQTSVDPMDGAMFRIHVLLLSLNGNIKFASPPTLTGPNGATMAVSFCATCGRYRVGTNGTINSFNPTSGTGLSLTVLADGYVWLGASVNPPLNQRAGTYTGTVTLIVSGLNI